MNTSEKLFLVLAEELNFRRTAEKCFITQQCLSDHIRRLETHYGTRLLNRKPSVSLTPAGAAVIRTLRQIQNMEAGLANELAEMENGAAGSLKMGINYTRARLILPPLFARYHARYPHVRLELVLDETASMEEMLEKGQLDFFLGFNAMEQPPLKALPLAQEHLYLIASKEYVRRYLPEKADGLLCHREAADLGDLDGVPLITNFSTSTVFQMLHQHLASAHIAIDNILSISDYFVADGISRSGCTAFLCPQIYVPTLLEQNRLHPPGQKLLAWPVRGLEQTMRFDLIYNGSIHYPRFARDCFSLIQEIVRDIDVPLTTGRH